MHFSGSTYLYRKEFLLLSDPSKVTWQQKERLLCGLQLQISDKNLQLSIPCAPKEPLNGTLGSMCGFLHWLSVEVVLITLYCVEHRRWTV